MSEPTSIQAYWSKFGYVDNPQAEAIISYYGKSGTNLFTVITQRNNPAPGDENATGWWYETVVAHLAARGLLYYSSVSGTPCSKGQNLPNSGAAAAGVNSAGSLARMGLASVSMISSVGGESSLGFAAAGTALGSALGYATLGLGLAIGPLIAIIQHHAQAVQKEDGTICGVSSTVNQVIPQIDQAVATGSITAAQGIQAMNTLVTQMNVTLNQIAGAGSSGHPCNAGCVYKAWLKAHLDFANTFYVDIAPMKTIPAVAPGTYAPNAASASLVSAAVDSIAPPPGSPQIVNSTARANSSNLNAAGSQNGTFSSIPNIQTLGTGAIAPETVGVSMWIFAGIAVLILFGYIALQKG